jgi:cytochrome c-type biogenesis protein CcmH
LAQATTPAEAGPATLNELRERLQQLDQLHRAGVLAEEVHATGRAQIERQIVQCVLSGEGAVLAPAAAGASPASPGSAPRTAGRPVPWLWSGIVVTVLAVGGAGYMWVGAPSGSPASLAMGGAPAPSEGADGRKAPHPLGNDAMAGMVDTLARRLQAQPEDGPGWAMLARSYAALDRHDDALPAYAKAIALVTDDAALMADYADALALQQGRKLQGLPMQWVQKALKLDPTQPKALMLAGTEAFERQDHAGAAKFWDRAVRSAPSDSPFLAQARSSRDEARRLAGLPPKTDTTDATAATGMPVARVSGTVSLAPALAAKARPEDTVFIYARAAEGSRMPLAMVKRQVKDLPLKFELDDSMAMSPQARLSSARQVIVMARVSASGQAQAQSGDLEGTSKPVALGQASLAVVVDRVQP